MPDQTCSALMSRPVSVLFKKKSRAFVRFTLRRGVRTALRRLRRSSQARRTFGGRSHQTPNYQTHTDKARRCGGRCGCQLIGGITVFAHYHMLTVLMKARTGVKTAVGNLFCCSALKPTVTACNWCYIKNRLCQHYHPQPSDSIKCWEFEMPSDFVYSGTHRMLSESYSPAAGEFYILRKDNLEMTFIPHLRLTS